MATSFLGWLRPRQRGARRLLANRRCLLGAFIALALFPVQTQSQEPTNNAITIDETTRTEVAEKFAQVFADNYCHADLGAKVAAAIRARVKAKAYDAITSPSDFADALERDARGVVNDRHIGVDFSFEPMMGSDLPSIKNAIPEIRILDGNIGYMVVNGMQEDRDAIAAAFAFLHKCDALILDLRGNVGGSGVADMWYMSFLSEGPSRLLETVHGRKGPLFESKTIDVGDRSYGAKKPVFVLTSHLTFSAGEALAYDIQSFKRGLVVGETTGGGANPSISGKMPLGHGFLAKVPAGYIVNAATGTNWEGVGVKPDVEVPADQAFAKARSLALDRLSARASDPQTRTFLEALASAKLDGQATLLNAQLVGTYSSKSGTASVTITESDGKLCERSEDDGARNIILRSLGGDRYAPDDLPSGFSLTFVVRDRKVELVLVRAPWAPSVLQKQ